MGTDPSHQQRVENHIKDYDIQKPPQIDSNIPVPPLRKPHPLRGLFVEMKINDSLYFDDRVAGLNFCWAICYKFGSGVVTRRKEGKGMRVWKIK